MHEEHVYWIYIYFFVLSVELKIKRVDGWGESQVVCYRRWPWNTDDDVHGLVLAGGRGQSSVTTAPPLVTTGPLSVLSPSLQRSFRHGLRAARLSSLPVSCRLSFLKHTPHGNYWGSTMNKSYLSTASSRIQLIYFKSINKLLVKYHTK